MKSRSLLVLLFSLPFVLGLPTHITAQDAPPLCEIAFAPAFQVEENLSIPALEAPIFSPSAQSEADIVQYLVDYSSAYLALHYDSASGMVANEAGQLDIRATMISAFVWAEQGEMEEAVRAVQNVLNNQILDTASNQFGNFVRYVGEEDALDNNWSAFNGSFLLVFYHRYGDSLSESLKVDMLRAISASASHRLCQRYSTNNNIALLSSFVLLGAGNLLQNSAYLQAGWELWNRIATAAVRSGFAEYNSPNYYKVDLYALGFITDYSGIPELVIQAHSVRELLWWSITRHYHSPTQNLAGPYSRAFTDRMSYELSGIQPFLFRDSLGRIPLPMYPNYENNEQALHAILALVVKRSWREEWAEAALASIDQPRQIREQVLPYNEGTGSAPQMTTYLGNRMSLGSISADNPSGSARYLIAQAVDTANENIGVFRLLFPETPGYSDSVIKITQNMRSVLGVIQLRYPVSESLPAPLEWKFEWFGTEASTPQIASPVLSTNNGQIDVEWMDTITSIRIDNHLAPVESTSELSISEPVEGSSPLALMNRFTLTSIPPEVNLETLMFPLVFCIYFNATGAAPTQLAAPTSFINSTDPTLRVISWASPDGLLEMEVSLEARSPWYLIETLNGVPIERYLLAQSLPQPDA